MCVRELYSIIDQQSFDILIETGTREKGCAGQVLGLSCSLPSPILNGTFTPDVSSLDFCQSPQKDSNTLDEGFIPAKLKSFATYTIDVNIVKQIQATLQKEDVILSYDHDIALNASIAWQSNKSFTIKSKHNIKIGHDVIISNFGEGTLKLMAGMESGDYNSTVDFGTNVKIFFQNGGRVEIYYNPKSEEQTHKYHNPYPYHLHTLSGSLEAFMLVNDIYDLIDINHRRAGNYALSRDIDGASLNKFLPIGKIDAPFFGYFNGNGFAIKNINIESDEYSGIFGYVFGTSSLRTSIFDFDIQNISVKGNYYVGIVAGAAQNVDFNHIGFLQDNKVIFQGIAGGVVGSGINVNITEIHGYNAIEISTSESTEYGGKLAGALANSTLSENCQNCVGFSE